jgi:hypothetical protein
MEIKLKSCSNPNIYLFRQIHLLISQNHIPIDITTSPNPNTISKQKQSQSGGSNISNKNEVRLAEKVTEIIQNDTYIDPAKIVYKPAWTPYSVFSQFLNRVFSQKQNDTTNDQLNQNTLNLVLNKKKIIADPTIGIETLSKPIKPKTKSTILPEETSSLFVHIETNHTNPIDSIKGTKLYYLYQRQQNAQCAQFV